MSSKFFLLKVVSVTCSKLSHLELFRFELSRDGKQSRLPIRILYQSFYHGMLRVIILQTWLSSVRFDGGPTTVTSPGFSGSYSHFRSQILSPFCLQVLLPMSRSQNLSTFKITYGLVICTKLIRGITWLLHSLHPGCKTWDIIGIKSVLWTVTRLIPSWASSAFHRTGCMISVSRTSIKLVSLNRCLLSISMWYKDM